MSASTLKRFLRFLILKNLSRESKITVVRLSTQNGQFFLYILYFLNALDIRWLILLYTLNETFLYFYFYPFLSVKQSQINQKNTNLIYLIWLFKLPYRGQSLKTCRFFILKGYMEYVSQKKYKICVFFRI